MTNATHPIFQTILADFAGEPVRSLSVSEVMQEAYDSAADAAIGYLCDNGDNMDCGGAWVVVPGRSSIAKFHKAHNTSGFKHHTGGWAIPLCRGLRVQSRAIYEKGCDAFVKVLSAHGFEAHTYSYAD